MKLLKIFLLLVGLVFIPTIKTSPVNVALGTATTILSGASFAYWTGVTLKALKIWGVIAITDTTLIPRLIIDAVAIAAGVKLFFSEYEKGKDNKAISKEEITTEEITTID